MAKSRKAIHWTALGGILLLAVPSLCGCKGEQQARERAAGHDPARYVDPVTESLAQGRLSRNSAMLDLDLGLRPAPLDLSGLSSGSTEPPGFPEARLGDLAAASAQAEAQIRRIQLLSQAAAGMAAEEPVEWPETAEFGIASEEDVRLALSIVALRGEAAVLRAVLDEVLYRAPAGTEERLADVEKQLAEAASVGVGSQGAAENGLDGSQAGAAVAGDGLIEALSSEYRDRVAQAMVIRLPDRPRTGAQDWADAFSVLRRRASEIRSDLDDIAQRLEQ